MIGIVIATHGQLAAELLATAEQIVGPMAHASPCSVDTGASPDELRERIVAAVKKVDQGDGVIVFADLIGGSPCTSSLSLCRQRQLEVITGANLPMLLKAHALRSSIATLPEFAQTLVEYGRRSITCATEKVRLELSASAEARSV